MEDKHTVISKRLKKEVELASDHILSISVRVTTLPLTVIITTDQSKHIILKLTLGLDTGKINIPEEYFKHFKDIDQGLLPLLSGTRREDFGSNRTLTEIYTDVAKTIRRHIIKGKEVSCY